MKTRDKNRHTYVSLLGLGATTALLAGLWVVRPQSTPPVPIRVGGPGDMEWRSCFANPALAQSLDEPAAALRLARDEVEQARLHEQLHYASIEHLHADARWSNPDQHRYLTQAIAANRSLLLEDLQAHENAETTLGCLEEHLGDEVAEATP